MNYFSLDDYDRGGDSKFNRQEVSMFIGDIDDSLKRQLRDLARKALDAELEQPLRQLADALTSGR